MINTFYSVLERFALEIEANNINLHQLNAKSKQTAKKVNKEAEPYKLLISMVSSQNSPGIDRFPNVLVFDNCVQTGFSTEQKLSGYKLTR